MIFIWHENLPQPLFDKEGSFYDTLFKGEEFWIMLALLKNFRHNHTHQPLWDF